MIEATKAREPSKPPKLPIFRCKELIRRDGKFYCWTCKTEQSELKTVSGLFLAKDKSRRIELLLCPRCGWGGAKQRRTPKPKPSPKPARAQSRAAKERAHA